MTGDHEAHLVRRFYDRAWNQWDDTVVDELLADDFQFRGSLGVVVQGRAAWRVYRDTLRAGITDFHNEVVELVSAPGRAAARLTCSGHHQGSLLGFLGRGQRVTYSAAAFFTIDAGRLASAWVLGDLDELRRQLRTGP